VAGYLADRANNLTNHTLARDYVVLVCSTANTPEREKKQLQLLMRKQLDGLIIATTDGPDMETLEMLG